MIDVDPFDLPDWLGEGSVIWVSAGGVRDGHLVSGALTAEAHDDVACDLLAVDEAHPSPVAPDDIRTRAHLAWRHGQILLVEREGRLTLVVPGTLFSADRVLDALCRLAKAVGASPEHYAARLGIGSDRPRWEGSGR